MTFIISHLLINRLCVSEIGNYFNCTKYNLFNKYLLSTYYVSGLLRLILILNNVKRKKCKNFNQFQILKLKSYDNL